MTKSMFDFLTPNHYKSLSNFVDGVLSGEVGIDSEGLIGFIKAIELSNPGQKPYFVKRVLTALIRPYWDEFMRVNTPSQMTQESIHILMSFPEYLQRKIG